MELNLSDPRLRLVAVQVIDIPGGVLIKRGALETQIAGDRAAEVIHLLAGLLSGPGAIRALVVDSFPAEDRQAIELLLDKLIERRLIVTVDDGLEAGRAETPLDIFYWNFGEEPHEVAERLAARHIVLIGVNHVSHRLAGSLRASGFHNVDVVDYAMLRNPFFYEGERLDEGHWPAIPPLAYDEWSEGFDPESIHTLVATSDFGGMHWMREWNELCVTNGILFYPVVLQNMVGYVGPLVMGHETACFECLRIRQNSQMDDPELKRAAERLAWHGQPVNAMHPSMAAITAEIAAMELTKLHSGAIAPPRYSTLIEVRLLQPEITTHRVLKVPRCTVCSRVNQSARVSIDRTTFMPGNRSDA